MEGEKIIVSMTSWEKRIGNIPGVLGTILNQSKLPDKIIINLSSEEFPNKENDLPENVIKFINNNSLIEIFWIDGVNSRQWKKTIPTMLRYPNDCIICIDDDRIYKKNFILDLYNAHLKHPDNPLTENSGYKVNGQFLQHCGQGTLDMAKFYNNFEGIDLNELYKMASSDTFFTYVANKNNHPILFCGVHNVGKPYNEVNPLSKSEKTCSTSSHKIMWGFLERKYGKVVAINKSNNTISKIIPEVKTTTLRKRIATVNKSRLVKKTTIHKIMGY